MLKQVKSLYIRSATLFGLALLIFLFGMFPWLVQKYYSGEIYPYIASALRYVSSIFPFAIGDAIYAFLIGIIFYKIFRCYRWIRKGKFILQPKAFIPLKILNLFLILYIIFKIVWGLNYSRPSISRELGIDDKKYSVRELVILGDYFVKKTNELKIRTLKQSKLPIYSISDLEAKSAFSYGLMEKKNLLFRYSNPVIKSVLSSWLTSKFGLEGYYAPLSGEANINMALPEFVKPYVSCHEIGHQLGIAYED